MNRNGVRFVICLAASFGFSGLVATVGSASPSVHALSVEGGKNVTCSVAVPLVGGTASGKVYCWGRNDRAQLGNGLFYDQLTPSAVAGLTSISQVTLGAEHGCARASSGTVKCWGSNSYGNVGNSSAPRTKNAFPPVTVSGLSGAKAIAAGGDHTCAVYPQTPSSKGYGVKCWGSNLSGELGNGSTAQYSRTPVIVSSLSKVASIASGEAYSCALLLSGTVWCWGDDTFGQLGDRTLPAPGSTRSVRRPVQVVGVYGATAITVGDRFTCALLASGRIMCWGLNATGQLGDGTVSGPVSATPVEVGNTMLTMPLMREVKASGGHACAVAQADRSIWCWGNNTNGEGGIGTTFEEYVPERIIRLDDGPMTGVVSLGLGATHSCVTLTHGLACWGSNSSGELGLGSHDTQTVPKSLSIFG